MDTNPDPGTLVQALAVRNSVVTVFVRKEDDDGYYYRGYGSGFIIKSAGKKCFVMTNYHVIRGTGPDDCFDCKRDKIFVRMDGMNGRPWQLQGQLLHQHPIADLAIIELRGMHRTLEQLTFVPSRGVPIGTSAIVVGFSNPSDDVFKGSHDLVLTRIPAVSPGAICGPPDITQHGTFESEDVHLSCITAPGLSGGAVVCNNGVIALLTSTMVQISCAISSETINKVFKEWFNIPATEIITTQDMIEGWL